VTYYDKQEGTARLKPALTAARTHTHTHTHTQTYIPIPSMTATLCGWLSKQPFTVLFRVILYATNKFHAVLCPSHTRSRQRHCSLVSDKCHRWVWPGQHTPETNFV